MSRARSAEWVFGIGGSIAGTIYGTIVVMAVIAAGSQGDHTNPWRLAVFVAATVLLLWVAHFYAHALSSSLDKERRLSWMSSVSSRGVRPPFPSQPSRLSVH